ncbi:hypothetical protein PNOK_0425000 [Pyrrhoderma noxium]|uniref:Uncharacterized protein n=1 Tax=Pyrrhoderma noxium TaxID=2282107 RepID=A0A286UI63_9AGAM|nr:hypothetical protein PNOK_0425000 [Pyrrhoderma noxium]
MDLFTTDLNKDPMQIKTTNNEIDKRLRSTLNGWRQVQTFDSFVLAMESEHMELDSFPLDIPDITTVQDDVDVQKTYERFIGMEGMEVNIYGPLCALANIILTKLTLKPDVIVVQEPPIGNNTKLRWGDVLSVIEVKKGGTKVMGNTDRTDFRGSVRAYCPVATLLGKREAENEEEESNKRPRTQEDSSTSRNPTAGVSRLKAGLELLSQDLCLPPPPAPKTNLHPELKLLGTRQLKDQTKNKFSVT